METDNEFAALLKLRLPFGNLDLDDEDFRYLLGVQAALYHVPLGQPLEHHSKSFRMGYLDAKQAN